MPRTVTLPFAFEPLLIRHDSDGWVRSFPATELSSVVLDTSLIHADALPAGAPVLVIRLHDPEQEVYQSWVLRAGEMTADWAAARSDIAQLPGFEAPPPWLAQIAPEGTFFAQRYRAVLEVERAGRAAWVSLRRHPAAPPEVEILIYALELRR